MVEGSSSKLCIRNVNDVGKYKVSDALLLRDNLINLMCLCMEEKQKTSFIGNAASPEIALLLKQLVNFKESDSLVLQITSQLSKLISHPDGKYVTLLVKSKALPCILQVLSSLITVSMYEVFISYCC